MFISPYLKNQIPIQVSKPGKYPQTIHQSHTVEAYMSPMLSQLNRRNATDPPIQVPRTDSPHLIPKPSTNSTPLQVPRRREDEGVPTTPPGEICHIQLTLRPQLNLRTATDPVRPVSIILPFQLNRVTTPHPKPSTIEASTTPYRLCQVLPQLKREVQQILSLRTCASTPSPHPLSTSTSPCPKTPFTASRRRTPQIQQLPLFSSP
jgi:hypothetical protein